MHAHSRRRRFYRPVGSLLPSRPTWSRWRATIHQPPDEESVALPVELHRDTKTGRPGGARTRVLGVISALLSPLSYRPLVPTEGHDPPRVRLKGGCSARLSYVGALVRRAGLAPAWPGPAASKAAASARFAIAARLVGRAGLAPARVAPAAFEAAVSPVPPPTRVGAARRFCPGTSRVQAACAAGYTRAAARRGTFTAGSRCSSTPSFLLVALRCCVSQRWSARRELHPHTLAGPSSSGWCGCCFATSRCGAPGWFCPSDLRRVVPALFWLSYAGEWPPRQGSHLRPPASKAGALSAELLGAGRACRIRTGVWLLERELSLAARRTPRTGGATGGKAES